MEEIEEEKLDDIKQILVKDSNNVTVDIVEKKPCIRWDDLKGFSGIYWLNNMCNAAQMIIYMGYL